MGSPTEKERGIQRAARRKRSLDMFAKLAANTVTRTERRAARRVSKLEKRAVRSVANGRTPPARMVGRRVDRGEG